MRRGEAREKLISAAERLFSERWYSTVSVADICRTAGVSNGIAYHYYRSKEELLSDVMDRTIKAVQYGPSLNGSKETEGRLANYVNDLLALTVERKHLIRAFRQGQYRMMGYEDKLHDIYKEQLSKVLGRPVTDCEYTFVLSGLRFVNIRHAFDGCPAHVPTLCGIIENGLFPGCRARALRDFLPKSVLPPAVDVYRDARTRLLSAGKELFGSRDFASVAIADITKKAGISVGAFYTHFDSKEAFLEQIVSDISKSLRRFIRINMPKCEDILEEELAGLYLFLLYLEFEPVCYAVVRQAEYVVPKAAADYYASFLPGYIRRMAALPEGWDIATAANFAIGIAHYMGMDFAFKKGHMDAMSPIIGLIGHYSRGLARGEV